MTYSGQTIQNIFDALQDAYGIFQESALQSCEQFDDAPATVLAAEFSDDTHFNDLPKIVREATVEAIVTLAA